MNKAQRSTEVLMPLYRILEWRDGTVYRTESAGERWVPIADAIPGREIEKDLRLGTPTKFETRQRAPDE